MAVKKKILVVVDDDALRCALLEQLAVHDEFESEGVVTGAAAIEEAKGKRFDLILLDVGLPDIDGRPVCLQLRRQGHGVPIIILTPAAEESDQLLGFDSGANDYVTKPFRFSLLLARIRAQLRQHEQSESAVFLIGPYSFQPSKKVLTQSGSKAKVRLTEKETAILKYLCRTGNKVVPRETLLSEVWGYNAGVTTHTLETHIYRLRQKIELDPANTLFLVTELGGYRLNT